MVRKIAREVRRQEAFTVIYYEDARGKRCIRVPTTNQEHARLREIYLHDRPHPNVANDFSHFRLGEG